MKPNCSARRHLLHACLLPLRAALALTDSAAATERPAPAKEAIPYGGQAAIEGVMMKGSTHAALAVRRRSGAIEVLSRRVTSRFGNAAKVPYARGFFILWDMMTLGMWAITESSRRYEADMLQADAEKATAAGQGAAQLAAAADKDTEQGSESAAVMPVPAETESAYLLEANAEQTAGTAPGEPVAAQSDTAPLPHTPAWVQTLMLVVSLVIAVIMFKIVPAVLTTGIFHVLGWGPMQLIAHPTLTQQFLANLLEGLIKLGIFIGYIWGIGRIAEIARVFQYHGAEHIVINAYEHDPANQSIPFIQSHSTAHPRCGTSFIVILILASIVLFTVLDWLLLALGAPSADNLPVWWLRWPLRVLGLVPLSGISYEVIKAAFKYYGNPLLRPLLRFGMLFQALTTRRPSDEQIAVSLASFNRARFLSEGIPEPAAQALVAEPAI